MARIFSEHEAIGRILLTYDFGAESKKRVRERVMAALKFSAAFDATKLPEDEPAPAAPTLTKRL